MPKIVVRDTGEMTDGWLPGGDYSNCVTIYEVLETHGEMPSPKMGSLAEPGKVFYPEPEKSGDKVDDCKLYALECMGVEIEYQK